MVGLCRLITVTLIIGVKSSVVMVIRESVHQSLRCGKINLKDGMFDSRFSRRG